MLVEDIAKAPSAQSEDGEPRYIRVTLIPALTAQHSGGRQGQDFVLQAFSVDRQCHKRLSAHWQNSEGVCTQRGFAPTSKNKRVSADDMQMQQALLPTTNLLRSSQT